ncbi:hypothetical protein FOMG_20012 [Fusarium oxysporum f. sp. melonis 26406]|uniref:Zn(2)-C6 fungal-type domain-containing protein n=1 Tax=Fusarium oxysporum f. sp. melonis 26406 TaxID=1089452 RepID=W9Z4M0_FUSOX|nr:hypothetical protein FOMG_20012 [Fusarium oxysporum f. sp. melonis 26406]
MPKRYRQLLRAPGPDNTPSNSHQSGPSSTLSLGDEPQKRQRIGTRIACNGCRKRKIRCDGQRPRCEACQQRGEKDSCTYADSWNQSQPTRETEQILELFNIMKSAPESQAIAILRILRCNNEPETILPIIQASRNSRHYSSTQEWLSLSTSRLGLECELISSNPVSFPPLQRFESNILKSVTLP